MLNYDTRSLALGDNVVTEIEFDFLVTKKTDVLLSIVESGQDTITFRGDDTTYLSDLTFDSVVGGGTVTLLTALATGKTLYIDLDVQEPDQPNMFRVVNNYLQAFRSIERALDYLVTQIQTLSRWKEQSVRLPRHVDIANFDPTLPEGIPGVGNADHLLAVNDTGDGFKISAESTTSLAAQAAAALASQVAAAASEAAAELAETNAEAAQVAAEAAQAAAELAETNAETAETNAELAETNAAASAAAALVSENNAAASEAAAAVSAGAAAPTLVATRAVPTNVVGANGILFTSITNDTINYVQGSGGAVTLSHATRNIQAGTIDAQTLKLIGCSDVNTITMGDGAGIDTAGSTYVIKNGTILKLFWDQTNWTVESWNGV